MRHAGEKRNGMRQKLVEGEKRGWCPVSGVAASDYHSSHLVYSRSVSLVHICIFQSTKTLKGGLQKRTKGRKGGMVQIENKKKRFLGGNKGGSGGRSADGEPVGFVCIPHSPSASFVAAVFLEC